jgi:hypothetical protein
MDIVHARIQNASRIRAVEPACQESYPLENIGCIGGLLVSFPRVCQGDYACVFVFFGFFLFFIIG